MATRETILEETRDRVRFVTFNRPARRNAFNNQMYLDVANAILDAVDDQGVGAILLTGAGEAFCAGQDMSEFAMPEDGATLGFVRLLDALMACDKPVLTAVSKFAVGIGATMLLHTDINYFAEGTRVRFPFVALGVVPEAAASAMLPAMMGYQRAAEVLLTARWVSAEESVRFGLALEVVEKERLLSVATEKATQIARSAPMALRGTKRLMKAASEEMVSNALQREYDAFRDHLGSAENKEALMAFFEKRAPNFFGDR